MLMGERISADVSSLLHLWATFQEGRPLRAHAITCNWIVAWERSIFFLCSVAPNIPPSSSFSVQPTWPSAAASRRRKVHLSPQLFMHLFSAPLLYPCPMPLLVFSFLWGEQQSHMTRHHWSLENPIQDRQPPPVLCSPQPEADNLSGSSLTVPRNLSIGVYTPEPRIETLHTLPHNLVADFLHCTHIPAVRTETPQAEIIIIQQTGSFLKARKGFFHSFGGSDVQLSW